MSGIVQSERDLAVLRSLADRIDPSDAGAHNNLGVLYYQKGLIDEAVIAFTRAVALDPRMQVAQTNLEIAHGASGHYDRRIAALRRELQGAPDHREARWELGRALTALGRHEEAIVEFEALLAAAPDDVAAVLQLGLSEKARGNLERASTWFEQACERDSENAVPRFHLGETLYNRGHADAALAALEAAVARRPDYAEVHYLLAFVYGDLGRHDEARAATKRAVALNPTLARAQANLSLERYVAPSSRTDGAAADASSASFPSTSLPSRSSSSMPTPIPVEGAALAHYNRGVAFRQARRFDEALAAYGQALDAGEDPRLVRQAMAEVHLLRRDVGAALALYETLVRESDESPKLWNERGVLLHQMGRTDEARASYERALAADAAYRLAWNNLGVLQAASDAEAAVAAFERALQGGSHDAQAPEEDGAGSGASKRDGPHDPAPLALARLNLALLLVHRRQYPAALEQYQAILRADARQAVAWNGVGVVLMELRRFDEACTAFGRAIDADADLAAAHYNLSFVLSQLGDFDGALRETRRALQLEPLYVPQKFALAIDLQYELSAIAIAPDLSADVDAGALRGEFAFDAPLLDQLFAELAPPAAAASASASADALGRARGYISRGLLDLADAELREAAARGVEPAAVAVLLGDVFAKRGLYGEALERYRAARAARPDDVDAMLGEIHALLALGRPSDAAPLADGLARRPENDAEMLVARARVRLGVDDAVGALDCIEAAQRLAPGRPEVFRLQAQIMARLGDRAAALAAFNTALQLDPSLVRIWCDVGALEEERGNPGAARRAYERALNLLPTYGPAALALADLVRRTDSPRAAVAVLVGFLEAVPYDVEGLAALGQALLEDGRTGPALEAFARVLRFDASHPAALYYQGAALARQRQFEEAVQVWERVVRLDPQGGYGKQARARARSARELQHIFAAVAR